LEARSATPVNDPPGTRTEQDMDVAIVTVGASGSGLTGTGRRRIRSALEWCSCDEEIPKSENGGGVWDAAGARRVTERGVWCRGSGTRDASRDERGCLMPKPARFACLPTVVRSKVTSASGEQKADRDFDSSEIHWINRRDFFEQAFTSACVPPRRTPRRAGHHRRPLRNGHKFTTTRPVH
jgi:hypothetical protein